MKGHKQLSYLLHLYLVLVLLSCQSDSESTEVILPANVLNYTATPTGPKDRPGLAFSDQGAWFAYGFSETTHLGFTGPFLMTQGQGEWCAEMLSQLQLLDPEQEAIIDLSDFTVSQRSYNSHLEQQLESEQMRIVQSLFFSSAHTAMIITEITNLSEETITLQPRWAGTTFSTGLQIAAVENGVSLMTDRTPAKGIVQSLRTEVENISTADSSYTISLERLEIPAQETSVLTLAHTFIFPEYTVYKELEVLDIIAKLPVKELQRRIADKAEEFTALQQQLDTTWQDSIYQDLLAKTMLTLQNNTRIPAGELKHAGLFPSYHYKWFLGFWAWDSWKHAVALAHYQPELAKDQIRVMYDFQLDNGFIVDCVYRDTTIEAHNFRNTKPPLSAWAVWEVYEQDGDLDFVREMYPKVLKQHRWWYAFRDYDKDGICEYGSTDGTLVAAKWESGMDNAVRFDSSTMVKSAQTVFSLDQESVDLNAYLYAEKRYLGQMAEAIGKNEEVETFNREAEMLKTKIQSQFFDEETGWFYDTALDGESFVKVMGCEGWIPLWAEVATESQAAAVRSNMLKPELFNTHVPFQIVNASHPNFEPEASYWRGPTWLDQAYFGVRALHNYGYHEDAYAATHKLIHNAQGVLAKGPAIRENYNPLTGEGYEAYNFSWSAAHYMLLLLGE